MCGKALTEPSLEGLVRHLFVGGAVLSWVVSWPGMHKIHHSRLARQTDSKYGNLFSWWGRLFGTFTAVQIEGVRDDGTGTNGS